MSGSDVEELLHWVAGSRPVPEILPTIAEIDAELDRLLPAAERAGHRLFDPAQVENVPARGDEHKDALRRLRAGGSERPLLQPGAKQLRGHWHA